jgi:hypothetical protein
LNRLSRCYFAVREGAPVTLDEIGLELDSMEAANHEAASFAAEIGRAEPAPTPATKPALR